MAQNGQHFEFSQLGISFVVNQLDQLHDDDDDDEGSVSG